MHKKKQILDAKPFLSPQFGFLLYIFVQIPAPGIDIKRLTRKIKRELYKGLSRSISLTSARTEFEGLEHKVPLVYGLGADHLGRLDSPWTYYFLKSLLKSRTGSLIDIGANVGLYLIWLKSIDADREYIGFEPNPACYWYVQELIRYNEFSCSNIFPLALSDSRQLCTFYARRLGDKTGSLQATHRVEKEKPFSFDLITEPGDPIIQALGLTAISAMKIDVEGVELEVVRGLKETLANHRPTVICEVLPPPSAEDANHEAQMNRIEALLKLLRDYNYVALSLGSDKELHVISEAHDLEVHTKTDRILVHESQLDGVMSVWSQAKMTMAI